MPAQSSVNTRLASALRSHLDGDLATAEALYREILQAEPDDAQAVHYLGYLLQQTDRLDESVAQLTRAITLDDHHAEWHFNLGIAQAKLARIDAAIDAFTSAIALDPGQYFYWANLGAMFELSQEWERAEQCFQAAIRINPDCPDAFYLLSALLLKQARYPEARHFNYRGIVAAPDQCKSRIIVGHAYAELGRIEDAIALFERWLDEEPGNPEALHLLTAYRGHSAPLQCSSDYVERTFEQFANSFDNVLGRLKYCGPQLVHDHLDSLQPPPASLNVLDLGCGTGLIGAVLKPHCRLLVGVDLSPAMLEQAATKQIYHQLHKADITGFLHGAAARYALITCMDTLIYLGRLDELFGLIFRHLEPGGELLFSTEKLTQDDGADYQLTISGRYSHHPAYVASALSAAGFLISSLRDVTIRVDAGTPIAGQFCCARRPV